MLTWITSNMNGYIRTDQPAEIIQEEMRRQKFNLYRDKTPETIRSVTFRQLVDLSVQAKNSYLSARAI